MSQQTDITKEILAKSIKFNLSHEQATELLNSIFIAAEYEELAVQAQMPDLAYSYLRTQKDGLYGVSHDQIESWAENS
jgi:hypothetical protein